ncbi:MAG: zinc dependent phospholipase C family protein [Euryarchaeota archaeon]|nr:zinc dependent phospholipase C family protein [Euryarchaeota archaeon]
MKKPVIIFLFLMMISLMQAAPAQAWSANTHHAIADEIYYSMPSDVQEKLSLEAMRDGSDDPDLKFMDFEFHHYPASSVKAHYWLDKGKNCYKEGNYREASYCFGVASHYISDGLCAPHCSKSSRIYHSIYEVRAIFLNPHITDLSGDLDSVMFTGNKEAKSSWDSWMENSDDSYIQNDLNRAASASYIAIKDSTA